jgi:hypothetical protein
LNSYINKVIFKNIAETIKVDPLNNVEYYKCSDFLTKPQFANPADVELKCDTIEKLSAKSKLFDNEQIEPTDAWTYSADRVNKIKVDSDYYLNAQQTSCTKLNGKPTQIAELSGIFSYLIKASNEYNYNFFKRKYLC